MCSPAIGKGQVSRHFAIHLRRKETRFGVFNSWFCLRQIADQTDRITAAVHQRAASQFILETDVVWRGKQKAKLRVDVLHLANLTAGNNFLHSCSEWMITI